MANPPGIISTQDLEPVFTKVQTDLANLQFDYTTTAEKIAWFNTSAYGQSVKYPFSPVSNAPKEWPESTNRNYNEAQVFQIEVTNKRIAPANELEYMSTLSFDTYGILSGKLAAIVAKAKKIYDIRLAAKIAANDACYDGKAMFATDHPVNPNNAALGTYSNLLANTTLDEAGMVTALDKLNLVKGWDGELLCADGVDTVIVPNEALRTKALKLANGEIIASVFGNNTAAAGVSNALRGRFDVQLFTELNNYDPKAWYVIRSGSQIQRPFIVSVAQKPVFFYSGLNPSDYVRTEKGAVCYGWDAQIGVGYGLPQLAVKCIEP